MTAGFLSLGTVAGTSIGDDSFSGFDYPNNAQLVAVLGDGSSTYNAVLQESAATVRQAQLRCTLETADMLTVRGYFESREAVEFVDWDGTATDVRVLDFTRAPKYAGTWDVTLALIEADVAAAGPGVGVPVAGLATTLAAEPAIGDTNLKVASVTTVTPGQFVRVGAAGVAATEANSEIVRVLTVGTTGAGGTGIDIESDTGGGMVLDRASADEVKTVTGTLLAGPAGIGATNVKLASVAGLTAGTVVRFGYLGHYEPRVLLTVGTAGVAGTGVSFITPLRYAHSLYEWAVVVA